MPLIAKIALGIVALVIVAGLGLYVWGVVATTPPKGPDNPSREGIVKQAIAQGPQPVYFGIGWRDGESGPVYTVSAGPPTDDMGGEDILRVTGKPVPADLKAPAQGKVEIIFDGKLEDGTDRLVIDIGADYRVKKITEVVNGVVKP
jgi:hypothetical protein